MIFQTELTTLDTELSQLQALLDAKRQQRCLFEELDAETNAAIEMVALLKTKIEAVNSNAIASLKSAVLVLFDSGDNGGDGGNHPIEPTPGPDDSEPELLCLNGLTGECLTTADDEELPADNPVGDEWVLSSEAPLTGQFCAVNPELYWEITPPDGSSWEFASPYACLLWEDAPMLEQHCTISPSTTEDNENKSTNEVEGMAYIELVRHPENEAVAYQRKHDGEIICCYIGFTAKAKAQSWQIFVEAMTDRVELRPATRMSAFKYELKVKGLSKTQIDRLASECDVKKTYHKPWNGETKPPTYKEPERKLPVNPDEVEPGDIVVQLLTPSASYKIIQVMPNGILDCENMTTRDRLGLRPTAVTLVQKGEKPQLTEPIEFNDVVEVVADGNDTVGLVGTFGRVKTIKGDRIGVEIDNQLVYFKSNELSVKAKAEILREQQQLQSGQVLTGNRVVTTGNYFGAARRTAIANARRGTADKIAALELVKAGLSPELAMAAATGTDDDASDF